MNADEVVGFFDAEAAVYDAAYDSAGPDGYALRTRLSAVLEILGDGPGRVLDAGMGPGRLCESLAERGWTVAGVDPSSAMVARARGRLTRTPASLLTASVDRLPFPADSFDAAVATGVLEYTSDLRRALTEIVRVVRPGGCVVVSLPNPRALYQLWRRYVFYPVVTVAKRRLTTGSPPPMRRKRPPDARTFAAMLANENLFVERTAYLNYQALPSPLDLLVPRAAVRVSRALEGRRALAQAIATQVLFVARKTR